MEFRCRLKPRHQTLRTDCRSVTTTAFYKYAGARGANFGTTNFTGASAFAVQTFTSCISMPSNVEIKARINDYSQFAERASQLSQSEGVLIRQQDTFFNCRNGRLKLRNLMDGSGQLIFYDRPDCDGPKLSHYSINHTQDPEGLKAVLAAALGIRGEVRKERRLFLVGQTRVHLDTVEGLGHYMELEVVMKEAQSPEEGQQVARGLMDQLEVGEDSLVTGAYLDLLLRDEAV